MFTFEATSKRDSNFIGYRGESLFSICKPAFSLTFFNIAQISVLEVESKVVDSPTASFKMIKGDTSTLLPSLRNRVGTTGTD